MHREAAAMLTEAINLYPYGYSSHYELVRSLIALKDIDAARKEHEILKRSFPAYAEKLAQMF